MKYATKKAATEAIEQYKDRTGFLMVAVAIRNSVKRMEEDFRS